MAESKAAAPTPDRPSRRAAILDAALIEFNAKGVAGASIADIRRRSGASVGSIYHHFGDKDGIAGALYLEGLLDYQRGFIAELERRPRCTRDGVEGAVVHHHVRWICATSASSRGSCCSAATRGVVLGTERPLRELNRRFFGAVQRWVAPLVETGELREL